MRPLNGHRSPMKLKITADTSRHTLRPSRSSLEGDHNLTMTIVPDELSFSDLVTKVLVRANDQRRLIFGIENVAEFCLDNSDQSNVLAFIVAEDSCDDSASAICFKLLEASFNIASEQPILILKVDSGEKLRAIAKRAGGVQTHRRRSQANCDCALLLKSRKSEESSIEEVMTARAEKMLANESATPIAILNVVVS